MWTSDTDCALSEMGTKWLFEQYDHCAVGGTLSCQYFIHVYDLYIMHSALKVFVLLF